MNRAPHPRLRLVLAVLLSLTLASCAKLPTAEEAGEAVRMLREYDSWAWAVGVVLIWADVILPVPQTTVVAALGIIYGTWVGGVLGSIALITGALLGYGLMLTAARRYARRLSGRRYVQRIEELFEQRGAWAIVVTRSFPYSVPEALTFFAGLARMPMRKFLAAVTTGSIPIAFAFAAMGAGWADQPILVLVVSYALPIFLLPLTLSLMRGGPRSTCRP